LSVPLSKHLEGQSFCALNLFRANISKIMKTRQLLENSKHNISFPETKLGW